MAPCTYTDIINGGNLNPLIKLYTDGYRPTLSELTYAIEESIKLDRFHILQYLEIQHDINLNINILKSVSSSKKTMFD